MKDVKMTMDEYLDYVEALETLKEQLEAVKGSLYGLAGYGLEKDSPLHKLKMSVTDCINQAWRLKEGGEK